MSYRIDQVAGIGTHDAERLTQAGITTTDALLERCRSGSGRQDVATRTGVDADRLAMWCRQADLMRVSGIGAEYGRLLEHAGIEDVHMLATRKPENVVNLLHRVNDMKRLTHAVPSMKVVSRWISRARALETVPARDTAGRASDRPAEAVPPAYVPRHRPMSAAPVNTGTGSRPGYPVAPRKPMW